MAKLSDEAIDAILKNNGKATNAQIDDLKVSFNDVDDFGDKESLKECFDDIVKYNRMLKEKIVFINDSLTTAIPFTRENLYLICAYSGSGKSTIAANISYPLYKQQKKTLIIANEEPKQDILFRIASLELGLNFNDYKKGHMSIQDQQKCINLFEDISKYVKILDVNYKNGLTTKLEGVKSALEAIKESDYSCALIDYYQLIRYSVEKPGASTYEVLNDLRIYLGRYIKQSNVPIVIFAQLHSIGKRNNKEIDNRVKSSPEIIETATVIIEAIPNFEDKTTDFIIVKDRFGLANTRMTCAFDKGKFVDLTEERLQAMADQKIQQVVDKAKAAIDSKINKTTIDPEDLI